MAATKHEDNEQTDAAQAYALLSIDSLNLLIPRHEIRSLVSVDEIHAAVEAEENALGHVVFESGDWPVFGVSSELSPLHSITDTRRICAILHIDNKYMGLLCDQIQNIEQQQIQGLKPCMNTPDSPISGLLIYDNAVACATSTQRLNAFLVSK